MPAEVRVIEASYDRIKDWEMDPRGYFLIKVDREMSLIRVAFCALPDDVMQAEVNRVACALCLQRVVVHDASQTDASMVRSRSHADPHLTAPVLLEMFTPEDCVGHKHTL